MSGRTRTVRLGGRDDNAPAIAAFAAALGLAVGAWAAPWCVAHTSGREQLPPYRYQLVVPGVKATGSSLAATAKSGFADGMLVLETRAFGAPERLVPQVEEAAAFELALAPGSDPVVINARGPDGTEVQVATLGPTSWRSPSGKSRPYADPGVAHVSFRDGMAYVDETATVHAAGSGVEVAPQGHAGLRRLRFTDEAGKVLFEDDFAPRTQPGDRVGWSLGAALAAGATAFAAARAGFGVRLVLLVEALLALAVLAVPYGGWVAVVERLYLAQLDVGVLRSFAFGCALVPLAVTTLRALGLLELDRVRPPPLPLAAAGAVAGAAVLVAARDLSGWGWALLPVGALTAALPWRVARAAGQAPAAVLLRDLPALLLPAWLGWGLGLLPAVLWRLLTLSVDVPALLRRQVAAGADALLLLLLAVPVGAEVALRGTSLDHSWDPAVLAGAEVGGPATTAVPAPFWSDTCGEAPRARVYAFGGSSTGGAWQFRGDPSAFFPTALHHRLCDAGHAVETLNFGEGGRDSFDIAQAAPALFDAGPPAVVILYLGVNDLLTVDSPLTRKQRAELLSARPEAVGLLDRAASASRLFTGLGLLVRPHEEAHMVAAVPLPDAEENLRAIAAAAARHGGQVVFVPELTRSAEAHEIDGYPELLTRLGAELPGATSVDARAALGAGLDDLMTDRNHLSPAGGAALADALLPAVEAGLAAATPH